MQNRALIALAVAGVLIFGWLLIAPPRCSEPPPPPPDAAVPDAAPPDAAIVDAMLPDAFAVDDEALTVEQVKRIGLLDRPARFIEPLFEGNPYWKRDPKAPAPTWVNDNGVRLSFKVRGDRVISAGAELPETSRSADVTALSGFFVGDRDALPFRLEMFRPDQPVVTQGAFEDLKGRRLYFRAEMRREGELPWSPSSFEIATTPWPGQADVLTPTTLFDGYDRVEVADPAAPVGPLPKVVYPDAPAPGPIDGEYDPNNAL